MTDQDVLDKMFHYTWEEWLQEVYNYNKDKG